MKAAKVYRSDDGREFATADECRAYERDASLNGLVGLTIEQVNAGIAGSDLHVREAVKLVNGLIEADRKAKGEVRTRAKKPEVTAQPAAVEETVAEPVVEEARASRSRKAA